MIFVASLVAYIIETLLSGARRIRVHNGRDPVTKRPLYVGETISGSVHREARRFAARWRDVGRHQMAYYAHLRDERLRWRQRPARTRPQPKPLARPEAGRLRTR